MAENTRCFTGEGTFRNGSRTKTIRFRSSREAITEKMSSGRKAIKNGGGIKAIKNEGGKKSD